MVARENFDMQLDELKSQLLELGNMAKQAISESIEALKKQDVDKALKIIENDKKINELEAEIIDKTIWLIAKQQPVASDLRRLVVALRVTTDVERIGDLAVNISKSVIRIGNEEFIKPLVDIPKMADIAYGMIEDVLQAFYTEDIESAKKVAETDDEVDELYGRIIKELLELMSQNPTMVSQVMQLSFICRYLERAADHTTNISEDIIYLVKGKRYDLNG